MTGPEHYHTAEALLGNLRREIGGSSGTPIHTPEQQSRMIAEAQAHATLALTAATVAAREVGPLADFDDDWRLDAVQDSAWIEVAGA